MPDKNSFHKVKTSRQPGSMPTVCGLNAEQTECLPFYTRACVFNEV